VKDAEASVGNLLPGQWTFAAGVYDGDKVRVYKDGLELKNNGFSRIALDVSSAALVVIGDAPPGSPRARLMLDSAAMKKAALGDQRPVTGNWAAPSGKLSSAAQSLITDELEATTTAIATDNTAPATFPVSVSTYQLYKGGPVYLATTIASAVLEKTSLIADPKTNPLGIFRYKGSLAIRGGVTIQGTVILNDTTLDKITLETGAVTWNTVDLPLVDGDTTARQLPVAIAPKEFLLKKDITTVQMKGAVVAGDKFDVEIGAGAPQFTLQGALIAKGVNVWERSHWPLTAETWRSHMRDFLKQKNVQGGIAYFPLWLASTGSIPTAPQCTIKRDAAGPTYHWPDFSKPIFEKKSGDEGLRWRIVSWKDDA
jgi:hypothetical protein